MIAAQLSLIYSPSLSGSFPPTSLQNDLNRNDTIDYLGNNKGLIEIRFL